MTSGDASCLGHRRYNRHRDPRPEGPKALEMSYCHSPSALVANFIGASNWRDQRSGFISFDFISEAQEVDEDFSEFDDLDVTSSDQNGGAS